MSLPDLSTTNVDKALFDRLTRTRLAGAGASTHAPRFLQLYGSLRERSYSKLLTRDVSPYLVDRDSERKESADALSRRVNQARDLSAVAGSRHLPVVAALGAAQTLAWASTYYLPAMLAAPMARDIGVSTPTVFGAFSMALIVSALLGPYAGRSIDRWGARPVLSGTNLVFALASPRWPTRTARWACSAPG